jgi:acetylornithine deacetylase/succinyl-diaminopimelate desuccinylase-like protein
VADKPVAALDEAAIAAFAAEMIAIPTESPPGGEYPACVARVTDELARLGLDYQLLEFLSVLQAVRRRRIDLDWEVLQSAPCSLTPADAPFVQTVVAAAKRVTGATPPLTCCPGFLETRAYTALGVPAVACGPGLMDQMHGPAEYVAVANLSAAAAIYVDTARALDAAREGLCAEIGQSS